VALSLGCCSLDRFPFRGGSVCGTSEYIKNAGAFYSYIAKGLGKPAGVGASALAVFSYNAIQFGLYGAFGYFAAVTATDLIGVSIPWWVWAAAGIALVWYHSGLRQPRRRRRRHHQPAGLFVTAMDTYIGTWASNLMRVLIVTSIFAALLASTTPSPATPTRWPQNVYCANSATSTRPQNHADCRGCRAYTPACECRADQVVVDPMWTMRAAVERR